MLREHAVVVFLNANGERFSPAQWESLRRFIRAGGGFVGIHAAAVAAEREQWYQRWSDASSPAIPRSRQP